MDQATKQGIGESMQRNKEVGFELGTCINFLVDVKG